jgi:hypothetical protein
MNDEQLKQRIAYLVEHGGLHDADPLSEIRRHVRWLALLSLAGVGCGLMNLFMHFV